eukprot:6193512-Pleurochrysis_carterae.AAC.2
MKYRDSIHQIETREILLSPASPTDLRAVRRPRGARRRRIFHDGAHLGAKVALCRLPGRLVTVGAYPSHMQSSREMRWRVCYGPLLRLTAAPSRLILHISAAEDPHGRRRVALLDAPPV